MMPVEQLPVTARVDEGLIFLVVMILVVGAAVASVVYVAVCERRAGRSGRP